MRAFELDPPTTERQRFTLASLGSIPDGSGCYVLASFDGTILYIGQSRDIRTRLSQHLTDGSKSEITPSGKSQWIHFRFCPASDLSDLESWWVNQYKLANGGRLPHFNKVHPPSL